MLDDDDEENLLNPDDSVSKEYAAEIEDLFDQMEEWQSDDDTGSNVDENISISSTPKPSLKPFFGSSSRNLQQEGVTRPGSGLTSSGVAYGDMRQNRSKTVAGLANNSFFSVSFL